ncbi:MAG: Gfo/Idh/MocA family oxidoreductase [Candidatus Omnitrophota bacterium]
MTVRIGIVGCGKITERASLPNLANYPKAEVKCLCDIDPERTKETIEKFKLTGVDVTRDWKELVKRDDIDAVFVNTPNYIHEEITVGAAERKKHVLVEKPITISIQAAENMIEKTDQNGVFLMVEQTQRFDPVHQAAKKFMDSGKLGKINMVRGRIGHAGPEYWSEGKSHWFYDKKKSGGGAMIDVGVHILDLIRWLSGLQVEEVCANIRTIEKDVPVDDNGSVLLRFKGGAIGHFEASWTTRPYEVLTYIYGANGKLMTAIGSDKPIVARMAAVGEGKDPNCLLEDIVPEVGPGGGWENAVHYFIDCVEKKEKPFVSGVEGRETIKVILAAYESAKSGGWVKV